MKRIATAMGLAAALSLALMAGIATTASAIEIRSGGSGDFKVQFEPVKDVFQVGERIQFRVEGNKTFYLYLFSIDPQRNQGVVILPNVLQQYHKYKAGREYVVPEKNVEFYSEKPGAERIVMVASTEKLDVDMGRYNKSGNLFTSSARTVEEDVKALRFRRRGEGEDTDQKVTHEIELVIVGQGQQPPYPGTEPNPPSSGRTPAPGPDQGAAFISTDRTVYQLGEKIKILYGADRPGYVHLFLVEPDGRRTLLSKQPVSGDQVYSQLARAAQPQGKHGIVAVYSQNETMDKGAFPLPSGTGETGKGIDLIGDQNGNFAIYYFNIY